MIEVEVGDSLGISNRGMKAKTITSCDNAFVTNIVLARDPAAKRMFSVRKRSANAAAAMGFICAKVQRQQQQKRLIGRPQEALLCAKAKRQRQSANRNGNQPHVLMISHTNDFYKSIRVNFYYKRFADNYVVGPFFDTI
ncbi:hypothetical protein ACIQ57_06790 [Lysinibacillus xylanilyticus]|uniref:hypothetical protein n=1 Tax=Lysinibacillus xylanilyticus TaxID=582475 RepID=UPI0038119D9F